MKNQKTNSVLRKSMINKAAKHFLTNNQGVKNKHMAAVLCENRIIQDHKSIKDFIQFRNRGFHSKSEIETI
jgi:hypothetical protein